MATQKVGRNDPCPCGSGKKYKRCHGDPTVATEGGIRAAVRFFTTPDGRQVPVLGLAPVDVADWEAMREQLLDGEKHGILDRMDEPDHWEAVGLDVRLTEVGPASPHWSLKTSIRPAEERKASQNAEPAVAAGLYDSAGTVWNREWQVNMPLSEMVKWAEAMRAWNAVIIAPYDAQTNEFMPFGFQIWLPASNVAIEPWIPEEGLPELPL